MRKLVLTSRFKRSLRKFVKNNEGLRLQIEAQSYTKPVTTNQLCPHCRDAPWRVSTENGGIQTGFGITGGCNRVRDDQVKMR